MGLWLIIDVTQPESCYECSGSTGYDLYAAVARTTQGALDLARTALDLGPYDDKHDLHAFRIANSGARKMRLVPLHEVLVSADGGCTVEPPPSREQERDQELAALRADNPSLARQWDEGAHLLDLLRPRSLSEMLLEMWSQSMMDNIFTTKPMIFDLATPEQGSPHDLP